MKRSGMKNLILNNIQTLHCACLPPGRFRVTKNSSAPDSNVTVIKTVIIINLFQSIIMLSAHYIFVYKIIRFRRIAVSVSFNRTQLPRNLPLSPSLIRRGKGGGSFSPHENHNYEPLFLYATIILMWHGFIDLALSIFNFCNYILLFVFFNIYFGS